MKFLWSYLFISKLFICISISVNFFFVNDTFPLFSQLDQYKIFNCNKKIYTKYLIIQCKISLAQIYFLKLTIYIYSINIHCSNNFTRSAREQTSKTVLILNIHKLRLSTIIGGSSSQHGVVIATLIFFTYIFF